MNTFLIAGQSYAGNAHDKRLSVRDRRIKSYDMKENQWVVADDPQPQGGGYTVSPPGRDAEWGSIWPAFADSIQPFFVDPIRLITTSIYSEPLSFWLATPTAIDKIATGSQVAEGKAPILWQHGESDVIAKTSRATYVREFRELRSRVASRSGYNLTWILALSTHHPTVYNDPAAENEIRAALIESAKEPDCLPGPDTDQLKGSYRSPIGHSQHFSESGQYAAAQMWHDSVIRASKLGAPKRHRTESGEPAKIPN